MYGDSTGVVGGRGATSYWPEQVLETPFSSTLALHLTVRDLPFDFFASFQLPIWLHLEQEMGRVCVFGRLVVCSHTYLACERHPVFFLRWR